MEKSFLRRAVRETVLAAVSAAAFYLLAAAIFAAILRAAAPAQGVVIGVNWALKCVASFVFSLLFIHRERALFKGGAAGLLGCILALFLFAAIGGGFHVTALFPAELLLSAVCGGLGALCGVKLRKED